MALLQFDNLGQLYEAVSLYLDVDLSDQNDAIVLAIPGFVRMAEAAMGRRLRCFENLARASGIMNFPEELLPTNFGAMSSVMLGNSADGYQVLDYLAPHHFEASDRSDQVGNYTLYAGRLVAYPSRETWWTERQREIRMIYFSRPRLKELTSSNAVLAYHPDIYLYGSLLSAGTFVKDKEQFATWTALYKDCVDSANSTLEEMKSTQYPLMEAVDG